jgi:hypothetical protein
MGSASVFSGQPRNGLTEPSHGFRLCILKVPPDFLQKKNLDFNITTSTQQQTILLDRNPFPTMF